MVRIRDLTQASGATGGKRRRSTARHLPGGAQLDFLSVVDTPRRGASCHPGW